MELLQYTLGRGLLSDWRELAWQSFQRRKRCESIASAQKTVVNLGRWLQSGEPRRWVKEHSGAWGDGEWNILLNDLRASEFWPMVPNEIGAVLERLKRAYWESPRR